MRLGVHRITKQWDLTPISKLQKIKSKEVCGVLDFAVFHKLNRSFLNEKISMTWTVKKFWILIEFAWSDLSDTQLSSPSSDVLFKLTLPIWCCHSGTITNTVACQDQTRARVKASHSKSCKRKAQTLRLLRCNVPTKAIKYFSHAPSLAADLCCFCLWFCFHSSL